ncbi:MAG: hypothetical protein QNI91_03620 [Arenicellales bacterium]|nr:hypothetical protein [Arenicellales bacterium]
MTDELKLFDTTLRDGQLSPDVHFGSDERIEIACALERAGLDVIEVAFPGMHPEDISSTRLLVERIHSATLCCLARMNTADIDTAADVLSRCSNPRLHVYLDAKTIRALDLNKAGGDQTLRMVEKMVAHARNLAAEVEFSPQDTTRLELELLVAVTRAALAGGARIINLSDTTGTCSPEEIRTLFQRLFERIPELDQAVVSLHAHDHLGNSIDNALSAIQAGGRQIEGTINGIGPAGGNTDIVKVVQRLETEVDPLDVYVKADYQGLQELSKRIPKRRKG